MSVKIKEKVKKAKARAKEKASIKEKKPVDKTEPIRTEVVKSNLDKVNIQIENPVEKLDFANTISTSLSNTQEKIPEVFNSFNFLILLLIVLLLGTSVSLNKLFSDKLDPLLFKVVSKSGFLPSKTFACFKNWISAPYVLTIGEYESLDIANEEAIRLLPQLKQIDIKKLNTGIYTFEIGRFSAKEKAYLLAGEYAMAGFSGVHVRYLPNQ